MKKRNKVILGILAIAVCVAGFFIYNSVLGDKNNTSGVSGQVIKIDYNNLAPVLSSASLVQDLPKDGSITLKFYNFNSGQRQWEKSFVIKQGGVYEGDEKTDITLTLDSRYLSVLTTGNFCSVILQAKKNGDLGMETSLSSVSLAWKYKSMYKYRDCFGF